MPFDNEAKFFYGASSRAIAEAIQTTFNSWMAAKLNDVAGPYRADFHADVVATISWEELSTCVQDTAGKPVFITERGPRGESRRWGRKIDGVYYEGERREMTLHFDMVANNKANAKTSPRAEEEDDRALVDAFDDICRVNWQQLDDMGLNNFELSPDYERQRDGSARNPHKATFFICLLNNYNP